MIFLCVMHEMSCSCKLVNVGNTMRQYCRYRYSKLPILGCLPIPQYRQYRQVFLLADTDTADTEKSADMPIFPIPILVSAHP